MTLIKSISGIRGTIGGKPGNNLTPVDIVRFSAAYGAWLIARHSGAVRVVTGRDGRISGPLVSNLVNNTLLGMGISVTDLGMATTPTVEIAVKGLNASGGIIITASHNPAQWNALKLLNEKGEFLSASDGEKVLEAADSESFGFASVEELGTYDRDDSWTLKHVEQILKLNLVNRELIESARLTVAVDCINSVGGIAVPLLLNALGVKRIVGINMTPDGNFAHNPEPLPAHLTGLSEVVLREKAHLGFVTDPDVDRLAVVCEDGSMFGEEYTLVSVADYVLSRRKGSTVSNMSSTRALKDISEKHGCEYFSSEVGEVNVVAEMKKRNAVIGGEGNGGIILPELHYGRDALVGMALFLTHFAERKMKCSDLRNTYPSYFIAKLKMELEEGLDFEKILQRVREAFRGESIDERDGMKIDLNEGWIQIRRSNTEPIMRIYAEAADEEKANELAGRVINIVKKE